MADWERSLAHLIHRVEQAFDRVKYRAGAVWGRRDRLMIFPYLGYGSTRFIYLKGRVLADKDITPSQETDSVWINLRNMYRRFESDEVPFARVLARFLGLEQEFQADEEGFFEVFLEPVEPLLPNHARSRYHQNPPDDVPGAGEVPGVGVHREVHREVHRRVNREAPRGVLGPWLDVDLELLELEGNEGKIRASGKVMIVSPQARFGVVSDVDDTVVHTGATSILKMARTVFLGNAHTRLLLEGVADFYRALQGVALDALDPLNPLFYVSSSPWNLYDLFEQFFRLHGLPDGPLILRDWGFERDSLISIRHTRFKLAAIRKILEDYPDLPFILIGDSGEEDPEIYVEVMRLFPGRILAAYIRDVNYSPGIDAESSMPGVQPGPRLRRAARRWESVKKLVREAEALGSVMLLAPDTQTMALHAAEHGWINAV